MGDFHFRMTWQGIPRILTNCQQALARIFHDYFCENALGRINTAFSVKNGSLHSDNYVPPIFYLGPCLYAA